MSNFVRNKMNRFEEFKFNGFKQAWIDFPSQDNEGYLPDRAGFKAGWFSAWNSCAEKYEKLIAENDAKIESVIKEEYQQLQSDLTTAKAEIDALTAEVEDRKKAYDAIDDVNIKLNEQLTAAQLTIRKLEVERDLLREQRDKEIRAFWIDKDAGMIEGEILSCDLEIAQKVSEVK